MDKMAGCLTWPTRNRFTKPSIGHSSLRIWANNLPPTGESWWPNNMIFTSWRIGSKFCMKNSSMKNRHYVILRDDDTNALTPVECLERLYRPFLDRALPISLAVIPDVATDAVTPEGRPEGFLFAKNGTKSPTAAI